MKEWDLNPGFLFIREAIPPSHQKLNQKKKAKIKTGFFVDVAADERVEFEPWVPFC
jgi:hypothetical protein